MIFQRERKSKSVGAAFFAAPLIILGGGVVMPTKKAFAGLKAALSKKIDDALSNEVFEKAVLMAPSNKDYIFYCYKLSSSYNKMGNSQMAIRHAAAGLGYSDNTYAYELYIEHGDALFAMKRYDNAEQFYRKAGEFAPDRLARVEEKLANDFAAAIENYKNIIEIDEGYKEYAYKKIVDISAKNNKEMLETGIKKYLVEELEYSDQRIASFLQNNG